MGAGMMMVLMVYAAKLVLLNEQGNDERKR